MFPYVEKVREFRGLGVSVLAFDYRGYGESGGRPSERGTYRDTDAAIDFVGIDTAWHISEYWAGVTGDAQLRANADWLRGYVDSGRTGAKAGEGFYRYPDPAYAAPDFVQGK